MSKQLKLFNVASHANQGKDFEDDLEGTHDWYRLQGWADVRKIPSNWKFISREAYLKLLHAGRKNLIAETADGRFMQRVKSDVDFVGGGEKFSIVFSIAFDAKQVKGNRFPLANIKEHQLFSLKNRARCGILSGIMLNFTDCERVFFIHFDYLNRRYEEWMKNSQRRAASGVASLSFDEVKINSTEIFRHKNNMLLDWIPYLIK